MGNTLVRYKRWQKDHPNFITPDLIKAKEIGGNIVELSEGTDFDYNPMFGVSVIEPTDNSFKSSTGKGSKSFVGKNAKQQAEQHFQKISKSKKYWK